MSLFSLSFGIFLVVLFIVYFCFPKKYCRYQWIVLLAASYVFYVSAGAQPSVIFFLLTTTITTWVGALKLGQANAQYKEQLKTCLPEEKKALKQASTKKKRRVLILIALFNFGILGVVKYSNFFIQNVNTLLVKTAAGPLPVVNFLLPLGISFYTFQSMGYLIDIYRGKYEPDKNLFQYALFASYFPQIIQGPISRHNDLAHQLYASHKFDYQRFTFGLQRTLWGYFKKLVIADRIALWTSEVVTNYAQYEGITVFIGVMFYTIQIYADFSGGMDIVCGISQALGIELTENFKRPYFSSSVAEFWQRWHITLGSWMREYVFYPLAMSRPFGKLSKKLRGTVGPFAAKVLPTSMASFAVFILVGIWHGAGWHYVVYGLYQAYFVSTGTLFQPFYAKCRAFFRINEEQASWKFFKMLRTTLVVTIGRYFVHANSLHDAMYMLKATVSTFNPWVFFDGSLYQLGLDHANFNLMLLTVVLLLVVDAIQERGIRIRETVAKQNIVLRWAIYYIIFFAIVIFGIYGAGYDAQSFIYEQF